MKKHTALREPLAIVGMSCLFPDAESLAEYWQNIKQGRDSIGDIPASHWQPEDYYDPDPSRPDFTYARRGGFLRPYRFDPLRYGITPQSLEATDSTQLLGMVVAEEALRHAGYGPKKDFNRDRVSCILGVTGTLELVIPLGARLGHPHWRRALAKAGLPQAEIDAIVSDIASSYVGWQENSFPGLLGNVVAGRIANRLNLGGTNAVVDAACASSMGALRTAVMELETNRADMVITGGMDTFNDIFMYMCFSKTPALSPSGNAKPFDADGDGTILGEGLGAVVLKRLSDAKRDGDRIYALIKSIASSSDGRGKAIYAPSAKGQVKALRRAYEEAQCEPWTIELIECHGTGTKVGDGVEIGALSEVYSSSDQKQTIRTAIGSVKSQIGHTKAAAGVAGLIKAVMALYYKVLPPTIKIDKPHPKLLDSPFVTHEKARPWVASDQHPRRAAVSAFGFGGSNFHCILEEYQTDKTEIDFSDERMVLPIAGQSKAQLLGQLKDFLSAKAKLKLSGTQLWERCKSYINKQLQSLQPELNYRLAILLAPSDDILGKVRTAITELERQDNVRFFAHPAGIFFGHGDRNGELAFLFSGQGSQYVDMLRQLSIQFPEMLEHLQLANRIWAEQNPQESRRLSDFIYPAAVYSKEARQQLELDLKKTSVAQPALGAVSAGLLRVLERFAVLPDLVAGHSFGELTALHAAGVLEVEEFFRVACLRGQVIHNLDSELGSMLAVRATIEEVQDYIHRFGLDVVIANHNAPKQIVIAGQREEIDRAWKCLQSIQVSTTRLNVAAAFHSPIVAPAVEPFHAALQRIPMQSGRLPVYSNVGPGLYAANAGEIRQQLSAQIAEPVNFVDMVRSMYKQGARTFVEIGPQKVLASLVRNILGAEYSDAHVMAIDDTGHDQAWHGLLKVLSQLFVSGVPVKWSSLRFPEYQQESASASRFYVEISGANFRSKPEKQDVSPSKQRQSQVPSKTLKNSLFDKSNHELMPGPDHAQSQLEGKGGAMNNRKDPISSLQQTGNQNQESAGIAKQFDPLRVLEKHLLAMQEMQARNADLHQKYLEGQASNQKIIADLLQDYRQLIGLSNQASTSQAEPLASEGLLNSNKLPASVPAERQGARAAPEKPKAKVASTQQVLPLVTDTMSDDVADPVLEEQAEQLATKTPVIASQAKGAGSASNNEVSSSQYLAQVIDLIAEKTGYPQDMLNPDMHLESDLGIDSIKRVEIFSSLQEQFPQLASLAAEQLAQLENIADIVSILNNGATLQVEEASRQIAEELPLTAKEQSLDEQLIATQGKLTPVQILQVISDKTGYPVDMLSSEMDLESDLGIDSIKRVEIFSELQNQTGDAEGFDADTLNQVHTIADIYKLMTESAPAPSAASQTSETVSAASKSATAELEAILQVISDKTGYPIEMLQPEMDLESDLGIDSIKRVEILSALGEMYSQVTEADQQQLSEVHTIADLFHLIDPESSKGERLVDPLDQTVEQRLIEGASQHPELALLTDRIVLNRSILNFEELTELEGELVDLPAEAKIWVTDDGSNLARNIVLKLREKGYKPRLVSIAFVDRMKAPDELDGLIILAPQKIEGSIPRFLTNTFKLVKMVGPALRNQVEAKSGRRILTVVTRNGGYLGLNGLEHGHLAYGAALAGLAKTLRHEWPEILSTVLDLGKNFTDGFEAANRLLDACRQTKEVELGVFSQHFIRPVLQDEPLGEENPMKLGVEDSILLTGGARGVTFAVAHRLAHDFQCRLIIWGRSELSEEPEYLAQLSDETAIIQALRTNSKEQSLRSPKEWQLEARKLLAQREVKRNIKKLQDLGSEVIYQVVDVRSDQRMSQAIDELDQQGIIPTGLIHGAGILADRQLEDLDENDFLAVVDTKVRLLSHLERDFWQNLRFCVFFSSSTGRFGRKGQVAYAVANEALNKFAQFYQRSLPHCRTVAVNWGPWDGGMVDHQLKKLFEQEGLATIPLTIGADYLLHELAQKEKKAVEIVCLAKEVDALAASSEAIDGIIDIKLESFPALRSHVMKGQMVLPVVFHLELMIQKAKLSMPELKFQGFGNFRVLRGLRLAADELQKVRISLGEKTGINGGLKVTVALEALDDERQDWFVSSSADIWFVDEKVIVSQPTLTIPAEWELPEKEEIYQQYLFHGPHFQGINELNALSSQGVEAWVKTAPAPRYWLNRELMEEWNLDPLALDCAFQLAVVWTAKTRSLPSLPLAIHSYIQYQDRFPADGCHVRVLVQDIRDREFEASMEFVDQDGQLIASLKGYRGIMDDSLHATFEQRYLADAQPVDHQ